MNKNDITYIIANVTTKLTKSKLICFTILTGLLILVSGTIVSKLIPNALWPINSPPDSVYASGNSPFNLANKNAIPNKTKLITVATTNG